MKKISLIVLIILVGIFIMYNCTPQGIELPDPLIEEPTPGPTIEPTPEPTAEPAAGPSISDEGVMWVMPSTVDILAGTSFSLSINVNSESSLVAAFGVTLSYNPEIFIINNVTKGSSGFSQIICNSTTDGNTPITGFDPTGRGPDAQLEICVADCTAVNAGTTSITVNVNNLTDNGYMDVGLVTGIDSTLTVQ